MYFDNMGWADYSVLFLIIVLMVLIAIGDYLEKIFSWIKLQWKDALPLKKIYIAFAGAIGVALLILFVILYSQILLIPFGFSKIDEIGANFALAFLGTVTGGVALFSGFLAILRSEEDKNQNKIAKSQSKIADKQAKTAEEGLITDRISKATEGLGKSDENGDPVIVTRLGGLYALERIAQDSIRDHISIMEILCAYIYTNSPINIATPSATPKVRDDVEVAMKIIGRRGKWLGGTKHIEKELNENYTLDLRGCDLNNALLRGANLKHAWFGNANLSHAWLENTDLSYTWLNQVTLDGARLTNVKTTAAYAQDGDLSGCQSLTQKQINQMFLGKGVVLPKGLIHPQKGSKYDKNYNTYNDFMEARREWLKERGY